MTQSVELKFAVPLHLLTAVAAAVAAALGNTPVAVVADEVATPAPTPAPTPEVKPGKAKAAKASASAAPAAEPSAAKEPEAASAQATASPTPLTSETQSDVELPVYEKTDLGPRIVAVSESGDAERIAAVKALLATYVHNGFPEKKAGSGRHLRREDLNDFNEKFSALEAKWKADDAAGADEAMG